MWGAIHTNKVQMHIWGLLSLGFKHFVSQFCTSVWKLYSNQWISRCKLKRDILETSMFGHIKKNSFPYHTLERWHSQLLESVPGWVIWWLHRGEKNITGGIIIITVKCKPTSFCEECNFERGLGEGRGHGIWGEKGVRKGGWKGRKEEWWHNSLWGEQIWGKKHCYVEDLDLPKEDKKGISGGGGEGIRGTGGKEGGKEGREGRRHKGRKRDYITEQKCRSATGEGVCERRMPGGGRGSGVSWLHHCTDEGEGYFCGTTCYQGMVLFHVTWHKSFRKWP